MTICIGALCQGGKAVVFAADRMVTAGFLSLEFEHQEKKVEQVGDSCVVMSSGDALVAYELTDKLQKDHHGLRTVADIAQKLYDSLVELSLKRAEQVILVPRGLTWQAYRESGDKINPQLYMVLDHQLSEHSLETDFLVVGIDEHGGHVISLEFPGTVQHFDKIGFGAVGSGIPHATVSLCLDGQTRNRSLSETLYAVYVSKKKAESAPGVGQETDMGIITEQGVCFLKENHLESLKVIFAECSKNEADLSAVGKMCEEIHSQK